MAQTAAAPAMARIAAPSVAHTRSQASLDAAGVRHDHLVLPAGEAVECAIEIEGMSPAGEAEVHTLNAAHYTSFNSYGNDTAVHIEEAHVDVGDVLPSRELPAHSVTALVFRSKA